jgi:chromate reductase
MAESKLAVCGIAGSLRAGSHNRALLRAASELSPPGMEIRIFERLGDIPLFDADLEAKGEPAPVSALKKAIAEADAVLVATPEYNHGIPGVLKNAIDWASRPPGKSAFQRKPAAILGASPGMLGTARAQLQLRQVLASNETYVLLRPEVLVARAQEKFDAAGRLTDEPTRKMARQLLEALAEWAPRFCVKP